MKSKRIFVAVATGQNVSNFPPLLQFAQKGDHVVWMVTPQAKEQNWLVGVEDVLEDRGIDMEEVEVFDLYAPKEVGCAVLTVDSIESAQEVYFILNGGPKLTPFGLKAAGDSLQKPQVFYIHSDHPKCQYRLYRKLDIDSEPKRGTFDLECMLSLEEIVKLNGRKLSGPRCTWKPGSKAYTSLDEVKASFKEFEILLDEFRKNSNSTDKGRFANKLGKTFEEVVFRRVVCFCAKMNEKVVKEVVCGATISKDKTHQSELDVGIVLTNGTVLQLECKTGSSIKIKKNIKKDLQSRILALRRFSSRMAQLAVVIFPDSDSRKLLNDWNINALEFTPLDHDTKSGSPSFEEQLNKLLNKYYPDK